MHAGTGQGIITWIHMLLLLSGDIESNPGPNINAFLLNTRSIIESVNSRRNKLAEFQSLVALKMHCLSVKLKPGYLLLLEMTILPTDCEIHRKDRGGHGGILTGVHTSINSKHGPDLMPDSDSHNEILVIEIRLPKLAFINFYRPPNDNSHECVTNLNRSPNDNSHECVTNLNRPPNDNSHECVTNLNRPPNDNSHECVTNLNRPPNDNSHECVTNLNRPPNDNSHECVTNLNRPPNDYSHECVTNLNRPPNDNSHDCVTNLNRPPNDNSHECVTNLNRPPNDNSHECATNLNRPPNDNNHECVTNLSRPPNDNSHECVTNINRAPNDNSHECVTNLSRPPNDYSHECVTNLSRPPNDNSHDCVTNINRPPNDNSHDCVTNINRPSNDNSYECVLKLRGTLNNVQRSGFHNICVMGDFNFPNIDPVWYLNNRWNCEAFYDVLQSIGLSHLLTGPTHEQGSTLGFIMATCPEYFSGVSIENEIFPSDHYVINVGLLSDLRKPTKITSTVYNYRKADWQGLKAAIIDSNLTDTITQHRSDVDLACTQWTKISVCSWSTDLCHPIR